MMLTLHYHTDDVRLVMCEMCEGSGNEHIFMTSRNDIGQWEEGYVMTNRPCPTCHGTGLEVIAVETIMEEDLPDEPE